jgi:hypothetical protein
MEDAGTMGGDIDVSQRGALGVVDGGGKKWRILVGLAADLCGLIRRCKLLHFF